MICVKKYIYDINGLSPKLAVLGHQSDIFHRGRLISGLPVVNHLNDIGSI